MATSELNSVFLVMLRETLIKSAFIEARAKAMIPEMATTIMISIKVTPLWPQRLTDVKLDLSRVGQLPMVYLRVNTLLQISIPQFSMDALLLSIIYNSGWSTETSPKTSQRNQYICGFCERRTTRQTALVGIKSFAGAPTHGARKWSLN